MIKEQTEQQMGDEDNNNTDNAIRDFPTYLNDPISLEPITNPVWTKLGNLQEYQNLEKSINQNGLDHFGNQITIEDTHADDELKTIIEMFKQELSNSNYDLIVKLLKYAVFSRSRLIYAETSIKDLNSQIELMKQQLITVQQSGYVNTNPVMPMQNYSTNANSGSMLKFNTEGVGIFNEYNMFYKQDKNDKEWNSCLYSDELPKGLNIIEFKIMDINADDASGMAIGVVNNNFGPETKLSMMKKKGLGINCSGFKQVYNVTKCVDN